MEKEKKSNSQFYNGITRYFVPVEFPLEVDFHALSSHVQTIEKNTEQVSPPKNPAKGNKSIEKYLSIEIQVSLNEMDSITEESRHARPRLLMLFGVLSFLTKHPFTPYEVRKREFKTRGSLAEELKVDEFKVGNEEYVSDAKKILKKVSAGEKASKNLAASLLDRWRKALYLLQEIEESSRLYRDEALLSFFHILELLSDTDKYRKELKSEVRSKVKNVLEEVLNNSLKIQGNRLENEKDKIWNHVKNYILGNNLSIYSKISYMLDELKLLDSRTQNLIKIVKSGRNKVAHAPHVYQSEVIWPLPPFFPLSQVDISYISSLKALSARVIAAHYGLNVWEEEWGKLHSNLPAGAEKIHSFIEEERHKEISAEDFLRGDCEGVNPASIVEHYLEGKIDYSQLEEIARHLIQGVPGDDDDAAELCKLSVLLADSEDEEVANQARKIIKKYDDIGFDYELMVSQLKHRGIQLKWVIDWLNSGGF